jgi:hypothetical protein
MQPDVDEFFAKLDAAGEDAVRAKYAQRAYGTDKRPLVELWLARKDRARAEAAAGRADGRDEARIELAREANVIAKGSSKTARAAYRMAGLAVFVALLSALIAALGYCAKA